MMGAIAGDMIGSVYEFHNHKSKDFPLFRKDSTFTDDTVCTIAVAEGIMNGGSPDDFIDAFKKYGRMYPNAGYGGTFYRWIFSDSREPYNSYGNGAAMRISPVGWVMNTGYTARTGCWPSREHSEIPTAVTHNNPEALKGAAAVADSIFMARMYREKVVGDYNERIIPTLEKLKWGIREHLEEDFGYDLSRTLDEIRPTYHFDVSCQGTVPVAVQAFLESTDFEDAIRNAISVGGDSDTIGAITGGIAEAAYGIPKDILDEVWSRLPDPLRDVCRRWHKDFLHKGHRPKF